jgi:hypothetical protein
VWSFDLHSAIAIPGVGEPVTTMITHPWNCVALEPSATTISRGLDAEFSGLEEESGMGVSGGSGWRHRSRRRLSASSSGFPVVLVCIAVVVAGIWVGRHVYNALLTAGEPARPDTAPVVAPETWSVAPPGADLWWVQVGAFLDPARAQEMEASLRLRGFPGHIVSRPPDPAFHKVRAGVFGSEAAARAMQQALEAAGYVVYLSRMPVNAHPVTIAAGDREYLQEVGVGLELLGEYLVEQAAWWGAGGGWRTDRRTIQTELTRIAAGIRQFQAEMTARPAPVGSEALHRQVTALVDLSVNGLTELEAYVAGGGQERMVAAMVEYMRLVDAYDRFWAGE